MRDSFFRSPLDIPARPTPALWPLVPQQAAAYLADAGQAVIHARVMLEGKMSALRRPGLASEHQRVALGAIEAAHELLEQAEHILRETRDAERRECQMRGLCNVA